MSEFKKFIRVLLRIIFSVIDVITHSLFRFIYGTARSKVPPISDLLLLDSATTIAAKIRTRKVKCIDVVESFITRIEEINPILNCMVAKRFDEAREEAKKIDKLLESGLTPQDVLERDKPFLGVPFTTKDGIAVKGMILSAGLVARKSIIAEEDAVAVGYLKNAGAILLGTTNVSELCMWWESDNNVHGRTRNPYDSNRIAGGSSGGEGSLHGAAGAGFGLGSDIGGSIRMPAFFNGIFGHKPSPFIVPNKGQYPSSTSEHINSFLGIGPMCRHSQDLIPILKVIAGKNAAQLKLDEPVAIQNINIFYQEDDQGALFISPVNKEIRNLFKNIITHFDTAHKKKINRLELKKFSKSGSIWFACMKTENGPSFQQELANLEGTISLPWEWLKWFLRCSNHTFIALCTALSENNGVKYGSSKHKYLSSERDELKKELLDILGDNGVFIYPTHPTAAPYHNEPIFKPFNFAYTGIINVLGLPATHIPMGLNSDGLPIGLQVISAPNNDRLCIAIAKELEKAFGGWVPQQV